MTASLRVVAAVAFTLTARNEFVFETEISSDRPTPASLTHHSYFNLAGENAGPTTGHELQIFADTFAPTDAAMTLLGRSAPVTEGCDFRLGGAVARLAFAEPIADAAGARAALVDLARRARGTKAAPDR